MFGSFYKYIIRCYNSLILALVSFKLCCYFKKIYNFRNLVLFGGCKIKSLIFSDSAVIDKFAKILIFLFMNIFFYFRCRWAWPTWRVTCGWTWCTATWPARWTVTWAGTGGRRGLVATSIIINNGAPQIIIIIRYLLDR